MRPSTRQLVGTGALIWMALFGIVLASLLIAVTGRWIAIAGLFAMAVSSGFIFAKLTFRRDADSDSGLSPAWLVHVSNFVTLAVGVTFWALAFVVQVLDWRGASFGTLGALSFGLGCALGQRHIERTDPGSSTATKGR